MSLATDKCLCNFEVYNFNKVNTTLKIYLEPSKINVGTTIFILILIENLISNLGSFSIKAPISPLHLQRKKCTMKIQTFSGISTVLIVISCATFSSAQWTPDPFCPFPSDHTTRYPYYGDCSKYWECFEGTKYVMDCPEGLEFNAPLQQCDTPSIANCDPLASTTANPNPPTYTTGSTSSNGPGPTCPYPSDDLVYFPYEGDCTKYWECYQGNSYLYTCPEGLWWHEEISQCDYPGDFCDNDATTQTGPTTPTTSGTTPSGDEPDCTGTGADPIFYPYPSDCTKYYECANGDLYVEDCPEGLWWHVEANQCDYPGDYCVDSSV
jgi:hypothetical protein